VNGDCTDSMRDIISINLPNSSAASLVAREREELSVIPLELWGSVRLVYVATTRAKRELHFVYPLNVYRYGENDAVPALSRFLEPIPSTILPHALLSGGE
jgi:superfamily I DNA/RNA helicase